ncbi:MAG: hypothetical protein HYT14_01170 [Candidatus Liptonbacteria bacterium]|nr:hypothetical protein [Candidatus Liptonbacteria bacterium]
MRKMLAAAMLALFALGLPGFGGHISAEPNAPTKAPAPNPEFPQNYQLWMQVWLIAECRSESGKAFTYAVYGSVPTKAVVSLSRKDEKWGSFVYWQEAKATYFLKKGAEIRTVKQVDEFTKEVVQVAGPTAPSWLTTTSGLPKECALKQMRKKGTLAALDRFALIAP